MSYNVAYPELGLNINFDLFGERWIDSQSLAAQYSAQKLNLPMIPV